MSYPRMGRRFNPLRTRLMLRVQLAGRLTESGSSRAATTLSVRDCSRFRSSAERRFAWSPDGSLIVYAGPEVGGDKPLLAVNPDGTKVELPAIRVSAWGERVRFLPHGT